IIDATSFPQPNPNNDDPSDSISVPNYLSVAGSTFPFVSKPRTITASPQVVTVTAQPVFTVAGSTQAFPVPKLTAGIGNADPNLPVDPTLGLPSTGYALIDQEAVLYSGVNTLSNLLTGVTRGQLGTQAAAHAAGTAVGPRVQQGEGAVPFLKLSL